MTTHTSLYTIEENIDFIKKNLKKYSSNKSMVYIIPKQHYLSNLDKYLSAFQEEQYQIELLPESYGLLITKP